MDAMILSAGFGQRMRPLTNSTPKPLLRVGEFNLLEYHLRMLTKINFNKVVINVSYLYENIVNYFKQNNRFNIDIEFSIERDGPLGTAGGILHALPRFQSDQLFVINGDILTDYCRPISDLSPTVDVHMLLVPNPEHNPSGDFSMVNGVPSLPAAGYGDYTFSGMALYRKSLFEKFSPGFLELGPVLKALVAKRRASAEVYKGLWIDVGTVERLELARKHFPQIPI